MAKSQGKAPTPPLRDILVGEMRKLHVDPKSVLNTLENGGMYDWATAEETREEFEGLDRPGRNPLAVLQERLRLAQRVYGHASAYAGRDILGAEMGKLPKGFEFTTATAIGEKYFRNSMGN